jgi:hypothetical protein
MMSSTTEVVPDPLVLAAIDRASRHSARDDDAVPFWAIREHLGLAARSHRARLVRSRLRVLESAGLLESGRRHGVPTWAVSHAGREQLVAAQRAGSVPELPESPQHRAWRNLGPPLHRR